jgi:CDP-diacylglycerol--glycerol-3-phosphate 3-phosphatidyltransferase
VIKAWLEKGLEALNRAEIAESPDARGTAKVPSSSASALDRTLQRFFPFLFRLPLTPNQLTLAGTAMSVMAALALSQGWFGLAALGVALGALGDVLDGAMARIKGLETPFGAFLDSTLDRLADMALFLGLIVYYGEQARSGAVWLAGGALVGSVLVSYARARAESLLPSCSDGIWSGGILERGERILLLEIGAVSQALFPMSSAMIIVLWTILLGSAVTAGQRVLQVRHRLEPSGNPECRDSGKQDELE